MKTARLFFFDLLLTSLPACSQTSNEFIISGHIQGVEDGDSILLKFI